MIIGAFLLRTVGSLGPRTPPLCYSPAGCDLLVTPSPLCKYEFLRHVLLRCDDTQLSFSTPLHWLEAMSILRRSRDITYCGKPQCFFVSKRFCIQVAFDRITMSISTVFVNWRKIPVNLLPFLPSLSRSILSWPWLRCHSHHVVPKVSRC